MDYRDSDAKMINELPVGQFGLAAGMLTAGGYAAAALGGFPLHVLAFPAAVTIGAGMYYLYDRYTRTNLDNFFTHTPLKNSDGKYPRVVKTEKDEYTTAYHIKMPDGLSTDDFENWQQPIEQFLNRRVSIGFDDGLLVITSYRPLKRRYPYEAVPCLRPLEICPAYDVYGPYHLDIEQAVHILMAGATGGGKSYALRAIITSLILTKRPEDVRLILVDFQRVELGIFRKCRMVDNYCTTPAEFSEQLDRIAAESDRRLELLYHENLVNIQQYNRKHRDAKLPYIVVVVDEFATLSQKTPECKEAMEKLIVRTGQDRKLGIHYMLCTQRPTVDIISGSIKANLPTRISFRTASAKDSETILDEKGAETLRGEGNAFIKFSDRTELQFMDLSVEEALKLVKPTFIEKKPKVVDNVVPMGVIGYADQTRPGNPAFRR